MKTLITDYLKTFRGIAVLIFGFSYGWLQAKLLKEDSGDSGDESGELFGLSFS